MIAFLWNSLDKRLFGGGSDALWAWAAIVAVLLVTLCILGVAAGIVAYLVW
jgi:hypothetical protein